MRILGIDPGSETTGWGVIEDDGRHYRLVECGTVRASTAQKFPARLLRIANALEEIIHRHSPDACAIEDGFLATNVKVTLKLGQVRGVAMLVAERAALEIHEYPGEFGRCSQRRQSLINHDGDTTAGRWPSLSEADGREKRHRDAQNCRHRLP